MEKCGRSSLCRLCLCCDASAVCIFEPKASDKYNIAALVNELLRFQVSEDDGYPKLVCPSCLKTITDFKSFKDVCLQAMITYDKVIRIPRNEGTPQELQDVESKQNGCFVSDFKPEVNADNLDVFGNPLTKDENVSSEHEKDFTIHGMEVDEIRDVIGTSQSTPHEQCGQNQGESSTHPIEKESKAVTMQTGNVNIRKDSGDQSNIPDLKKINDGTTETSEQSLTTEENFARCYYHAVLAINIASETMEEALPLLEAAAQNIPDVAVLERRVLRDSSNPYELPDDNFIALFRLNKDAMRYIADSLREPLQRQRRHGLSVEAQVFAAIRFFATGSYQTCVGQDYLISMSQPSISNCIKAVSSAIREILTPQWITFPRTPEELLSLKQRFSAIAQITGVVGCIDCTHVPIIKPNVNEATFINNKGYHSINVQAICNPEMHFTNLNARYPGSVQDSFIWHHSAVRDDLSHRWGEGDHSLWLLGDSGYPLEPWLMTPVLNAAQGSAEARYTEAHARTRNTIDRAFGLLKNNFRCLLQHRRLHYKPLTAAHIITACATLHNIRMHTQLGDTPIDVAEDDYGQGQVEAEVEQERPPPGHQYKEAVLVRNMLIKNFRN